MEAAKAAISKHTGRQGHFTDVQEHVQPSVTWETVKPHRHEQFTQAVDREIHQHHYHTTVQPISHTETIPTKHTHNLLPLKSLTIKHDNEEDTQRKVAELAAHFRHNSTTHPVVHSRADQPTVIGEHHHHHVHETVQPVIYKETIQKETVHTTVPVHEIHHAVSQHHSLSALPIKSLTDFLKFNNGRTPEDIRHSHHDGPPRAYDSKLSTTFEKLGIKSPSASGSHTQPHPTVDTNASAMPNAVSNRSSPTTPTGMNNRNGSLRTNTISNHNGLPSTTTTPVNHNIPVSNTRNPASHNILPSTTTNPTNRDGLLPTTTNPTNRDGLLPTTTNANNHNVPFSDTRNPANHNILHSTTTNPANRDGLLPSNTNPVNRDGLLPTTTTPANRDGLLPATTNPNDRNILPSNTTYPANNKVSPNNATTGNHSTSVTTTRHSNLPNSTMTHHAFPPITTGNTTTNVSTTTSTNNNVAENNARLLQRKPTPPRGPIRDEYNTPVTPTNKEMMSPMSGGRMSSTRSSRSSISITSSTPSTPNTPAYHDTMAVRNPTMTPLNTRANETAPTQRSNNVTFASKEGQVNQPVNIANTETSPRMSDDTNPYRRRSFMDRITGRSNGQIARAY